MITPSTAAVRIGHQLQKLEEDLDQLLVDTSGLTSAMVSARIQLKLSPSIGHTAVADVTSVQQKLVDCRRELIRAHKNLRKIAEERADMPTECPKTAVLEERALIAA